VGENKREGGRCKGNTSPSQDHRTGLFVATPPSSVCCDDTRLMKEVNDGSLSFQTLVYSK